VRRLMSVELEGPPSPGELAIELASAALDCRFLRKLQSPRHASAFGFYWKCRSPLSSKTSVVHCIKDRVGCTLSVSREVMKLLAQRYGP
jgi:hypothetical protein